MPRKRKDSENSNDNLSNEQVFEPDDFGNLLATDLKDYTPEIVRILKGMFEDQDTPTRDRLSALKALIEISKENKLKKHQSTLDYQIIESRKLLEETETELEILKNEKKAIEIKK